MDAINPAHGSVLRVNSPSLGIFSLRSSPPYVSHHRRCRVAGSERREERDERKEGGGLVTHVPFPTALSARYVSLSLRSLRSLRSPFTRRA